MKVDVFVVECSSCARLWVTLDNEKPECPSCGSCTRDHFTLGVKEISFKIRRGVGGRREVV